MNIFVRYGHSEEFQGADGILNEVEVIREYAPYLAQKLYYAGHSVRTFNPDTYYIDYNSNYDEIHSGIDIASDNDDDKDGWIADIFVSCHVNGGGGDYSSVLAKENNNLSIGLAKAISSDVSNLLGIPDKGAIFNQALWEMSDTPTDMPVIIIEPFFVDTQSNCNAYNVVGGQVLGETIADAILAYI